MIVHTLNLVEQAEMLADIAAYERVKAELESGEDEIVPWELLTRRVAGESPLKIWREYRNLTQAGLAKASGVSRPMIAAIETGHKQGGITTLRKLAAALKVSMEQL